MRRIDIWQVWSGRWLYAVYINGRVAVLGECSTRERAELEAATA